MVKIETLMLIWSNFYFQSLLKIVLIIVFAGIIGMERDKSNKPAGFRTYTLLGLSAVLVVLCGEYLSKIYDMDPFRIAAQFLSGIGFIGAGTILRDGFNVKGLTTASGLLCISCIGLCVGAGAYIVAFIATMVTYFVISYSYLFTDKLDHFDMLELELNTKEEVSDFMEEIQEISDRYDIELKQIKDITEEDSKYNTIKIVCKYNNKMLTKNKVITQFSRIQNLKNISEISH